MKGYNDFTSSRSSGNTFVLFYHGTISALYFLGGLALVGVGIYAEVTHSGKFDLKWTNDFWKVVSNFGIAGIVVGAVIALVGAFGFFAFGRGCCGKFFKFVYFVLIILCFLVLLFTAIVTLMLANGDNVSPFKSAACSAWKQTESDDPQEICKIQNEYNCCGFSSSCDPTTTISTCSCALTNHCYETIIHRYHKWYLPIGIVSCILGALTLIDSLVICCV
ncbi:hypothetical protein GpartN1_g2934.t1 [Galdieria partita]|uniref:Tetraspanin n=1 Tax=Galdieria partita TaxID=83374 RepID=A0A9C7PUK8_9RHOD|nr:hypothetical protein GpartN1_g2934.t1 [Galdieria partita]